MKIIETETRIVAAGVAEKGNGELVFMGTVLVFFCLFFPPLPHLEAQF